MAKRKKKTSLSTEKPKSDSAASLFVQLRLHESYSSLLLGVVVVVVAAVLALSFIKAKGGKYILPITTQDISSDKTQKEVKTNSVQVTYVVSQGDTLKSISLKFYGTEDRYIDIAKANNIANPDLLEVGVTLTIPPGKAVKVEESNAIAGDSYTVKADDQLWDIAVRAYGDGFRWEEIATANNLGYPDMLTEGMVLIIPR